MDPVTALGAAGSIVGIVGFGLQIAATLQTYTEATLEADERIRDIANDINATASALQRLQDVITRDSKLPQGRVFSVEGLNVVNKIASQCDVVFTRIVQLLNKAGRPGSELSNSQRAKDLTLSTLDHLKWPWLEPKIARCRQELERLLLKLLLMLQISNLARQQTTTLGNISSQQALAKQLEREKQLKGIIAKLKAREERLTHSLEAAIFGGPVRGGGKLWWQASGRGIVTAVPRTRTFKTEGSSTILPHEVRRSLERHHSVQDAPRENIETWNRLNVPLDSGNSPEDDMPGDSVEQKNSKGVEFDETTKQTHKTTPLKASTPPEETPPGRSTQPEQAQPTTRPETSVINQRLEVYLIKGDRDEKYLLKLALRQEELKKQMNAVLSRTQSPIWDTLISLTPKEQANVHYVLEYSKKQDNIDPVLVAIEVRKAEVALVSPEPQQILLFLSKEAGNIGAQPLDREQQTYTRMSRRYLSIETLNRYRIPYEFDIDPNYILIKRWVPEYEQDFLWDHTRKARERREEPIVLAIDSSKKEHHHRHHLEPEFEFVRKTKHHHQKHTSKPNPSPLLKFLSGKSTHGKDTPKIDEERDTVVDQEKVDDLLAKYTTVYKENEQSGKNVETEKLKNQREKDTSAEISSNEEDRLGEEFLRSTNLDDYFSDDEQSVSSSSVSTRKSRFMRRLRKLWPFSGPRIRFRRKRGSGSSWSSSGSLSSAS